MNPAPIGVFDSGLGGLTAVRELCRVLPGEDIVYFGDIARVPYGNRSVDTLVKFARQDAAFLLSHGVKALVAACGTVSSTLPVHEAARFSVPFTGIIPAAARAAAKASSGGHIGVIATESAIATGCYETALAAIDPTTRVTATACPLFVPLVEYGHFGPGDAMARLAVEEYLAPLRNAGVDTLILGCTHYPLLAGAIGEFMGPDVALVDPGRETALALREDFAQKGLLAERESGGAVRYYVSAATARFNHLAALFLGQEIAGGAQQIDIEAY